MAFDEQLESLEKISKMMENENLTLDQSVELFGDGMNISKQCFEMLGDLKGKIYVIKKDLDKYKEVETTKEMK